MEGPGRSRRAPPPPPPPWSVDDVVAMESLLSRVRDAERDSPYRNRGFNPSNFCGRRCFNMHTCQKINCWFAHSELEFEYFSARRDAALSGDMPLAQQVERFLDVDIGFLVDRELKTSRIWGHRGRGDEYGMFVQPSSHTPKPACNPAELNPPELRESLPSPRSPSPNPSSSHALYPRSRRDNDIPPGPRKRESSDACPERQGELGERPSKRTPTGDGDYTGPARDFDAAPPRVRDKDPRDGDYAGPVRDFDREAMRSFVRAELGVYWKGEFMLECVLCPSSPMSFKDMQEHVMDAKHTRAKAAFSKSAEDSHHLTNKSVKGNQKGRRHHSGTRRTRPLERQCEEEAMAVPEQPAEQPTEKSVDDWLDQPMSMENWKAMEKTFLRRGGVEALSFKVVRDIMLSPTNGIKEADMETLARVQKRAPMVLQPSGQPGRRSQWVPGPAVEGCSPEEQAALARLEDSINVAIDPFHLPEKSEEIETEAYRVDENEERRAQDPRAFGKLGTLPGQSQAFRLEVDRGGNEHVRMAQLEQSVFHEKSVMRDEVFLRYCVPPGVRAAIEAQDVAKQG